LKSSAHPPTGLLSSPEFTQSQTATASGSNSPEVLVPFSDMTTEARFTRAYLTRHLPSPGFLTLLTVYVLDSFLALFHARAAPGVFSLQGVSPSQSLSGPLGLESPPGVTPAVSEQALTVNAHLQGFFPCEDPSPQLAGVTRSLRPLPSWDLCLRRNSPSLQARNRSCSIPS
jgi:hypothetical protein